MMFSLYLIFPIGLGLRREDEKDDDKLFFCGGLTSTIICLGEGRYQP